MLIRQFIVHFKVTLHKRKDYQVFLHRIAPSCVRDASSFTMWIRFTRAFLQEEPPKSKAKYFLFRLNGSNGDVSVYFICIYLPVSLRLKQDVI